MKQQQNGPAVCIIDYVANERVLFGIPMLMGQIYSNMANASREEVEEKLTSSSSEKAPSAARSASLLLRTGRSPSLLLPSVESCSIRMAFPSRNQAYMPKNPVNRKQSTNREKTAVQGLHGVQFYVSEKEIKAKNQWRNN